VKLRALAAALVAALVGAGAASAEPAFVGYPSSMASTGDSITRAFNTCFFPFTDCTGNSWTTGTSTTVNSHYRRILAANPAISGRNFNQAVTGAEMDELNAQAQQAVARGARYVTILMGANDVCKSNEASMTPVATYRAELAAAMATLSAGLPNSRIYIVSIPNIYNLWSVLRNNGSARFVWGLFGICQSMLANPLSNAEADVQRRNRVRQRNIDFNTQLREVCALYIHCRYDNDAAFNTTFVASDVSTRDYFHPSVAGQQKAATVTWGATFNFTDAVAPVSTATVNGSSVTLSATDAAGVSGIEYRLWSGSWTRYTGPVALAPGTTITWRAVDVNGNVEATQSLTG
jgi:lysophospholipase L1-like esterase